MSLSIRDKIVVGFFAELARPIMLRWFNRGSCIASARIAVEVLRIFGVEVHPVPVRWVLQLPGAKMAFVVGLNAEEQADARRKAESFVEVEQGPVIRGGGKGTGWNGHVILRGDGFLLDPSFDQALHALAQRGAAIESKPMIVVFPTGPDPLPEEFNAKMGARLDDGTEVTIDYATTGDDSYMQTPAWETDHLEPVIAEVITTMQRLAREMEVEL